MADLTREEQFLSGIAEGSTVELKPITRREQYLAKIAGQDVEVPDPITREEMLLKQIADGGGGGGSSVTVEPLTVAENGTTTAPAGKAYSPVTVNVPVPQVFVAQKQVSGDRVIYNFGRSVEECAIGPIWGEFSKTGGGMSLSLGNPRVYDGNGSYDQGSFDGDGFRFTSSVVSTGNYPSMLVAVTPEDS